MEPNPTPAERFCRLTRTALRASRASDWDADFTTTVLAEIEMACQTLPRLRFTSPQAHGYLIVAEACVDGLSAANSDIVPLTVAKALRSLVLKVIVAMPDSSKFGWLLHRADQGFRFEAGYLPPRRSSWRTACTTVVADDLPPDVRLACAAYFGQRSRNRTPVHAEA